jgi:hypothetical protein
MLKNINIIKINVTTIKTAFFSCFFFYIIIPHQKVQKMSIINWDGEILPGNKALLFLGLSQEINKSFISGGGELQSSYPENDKKNLENGVLFENFENSSPDDSENRFHFKDKFYWFLAVVFTALSSWIVEDNKWVHDPIIYNRPLVGYVAFVEPLNIKATVKTTSVLKSQSKIEQNGEWKSKLVCQNEWKKTTQLSSETRFIQSVSLIGKVEAVASRSTPNVVTGAFANIKHNIRYDIPIGYFSNAKSVPVDVGIQGSTYQETRIGASHVNSSTANVFLTLGPENCCITLKFNPFHTRGPFSGSAISIDNSLDIPRLFKVLFKKGKAKSHLVDSKVQPIALKPSEIARYTGVDDVLYLNSPKLNAFLSTIESLVSIPLDIELNLAKTYQLSSQDFLTEPLFIAMEACHLSSKTKLTLIKYLKSLELRESNHAILYECLVEKTLFDDTAIQTKKP